MKRSIWKYEIDQLSPGEFSLEIPGEGYHKPDFLSLEVQNGTPVMWFMVYVELPKTVHRFGVAWTGQDVPDEWMGIKPLGTFQRGGLVSHVFHLDATKIASYRVR